MVDVSVLASSRIGTTWEAYAASFQSSARHAVGLHGHLFTLAEAASLELGGTEDQGMAGMGRK